MAIKQLSVFAENKNGSLYEITKILSDAKIDIRAFSIAETSSFGVLRLIVSDARAAALILSEEGKIVNVNEVVGVEIPDTCGGLSDLLHIVDQKDISVDYLYAFLSDKSDKAHVVLRVADNDRLESLMTENGYKLMVAEDLA